MDFKYLLLTDDGAPKYGWDGHCTYEEADAYDGNVAVLVEYPFVVIDVDSHEEADALVDYVDKARISTRILNTDNGAHFWFRTPEPLTNHISAKTVIDVDIDIKSWGKSSMLTVKKHGKWREWDLESYRNDEVSLLPAWLLPLAKGEADRILESLSITGRGLRHKALLNCVYPLNRCGFDPDTIYEILSFVNKHMMDSPVDEVDLEAMTINNSKLTEETFYIIKKDPISGREKQVLDTNKVSLYLQRKKKLVLEDGVIWIRNNMENKFEVNQTALEAAVHTLLPQVNDNARKEILKKLKLNMFLKPGFIKKLEKHEVAVGNGILDMSTGRLKNLSEDVFLKRSLKTRYNRRAKSEVLDTLMNNLFQGDEELITLTYQMIGYSLVSHCDFQKAFMLYGSGKNGKSILMGLIRDFLGASNTSSTKLNALTNPNGRASLLGKYANIGDDIGKTLKESEEFKSIVVGQPVNIKLLYVDLFDASLTAKLIYGANNLPYVDDKSDGYFRRWIMIPFKVKFTKGSKNFDPFIADKLKAPEVMEALLNECVKAYQMLLEDHDFIQSDASDAVLREYRSDSDSVFAYIQEQDIEDMDVMESYVRYKQFSVTNGYTKLLEMRGFTKRVKQLTDMKTVNYTRNKQHTRVWKKY